MSSEHHVNIFFESKSLESDTFAVVRFEGQEEISRPYRFVVDMVSDRPDVDLDAARGRPATRSFNRGDDGDLRKIHGVLAEIELGREGQHGHYAYRAVLVPRLWMMSLTRQNQIYQNKTIPEIVEEELKGSKGKGPAGNSTFEFAADDFEFRLTGSYPQKEYLVQYAESDLDFISRLLEHVGIYYFFEQGEDRERIVFCDANVHLPALPGENSFPYMPPSGTSSNLVQSVHFLTSRRRQITDKVLLKDYNYRTPQTPLQAEQDVEGDGYGVACYYGDHFKTPEEGQALAQVRAEEVLCGKALFRGAGDCHGFTAGHILELEEHFSDALNQEYLLTGVRHAGSQASSEATGFGEGEGGEATSYRNEFRAIPKTVAYRPSRRTAKPKLIGVMSARVDGSGAGTRAEIDGEGRYKLVMPFDISGSAEGKATRWVRMAQPYGGGQQGMHFPLLKGTEVLWTCVDGDPDRPVITGVVPNPLNKSVVNAESHTKNRIQTASGIVMEFQDGPGPAAQAASVAGGRLSGQQQAQRIAGCAPTAAVVSASGLETVSTELMPNKNAAASNASHDPAHQGLQVQQHYQQPVGSNSDTGPEDLGHIEQEQKWFRVEVPNYDGSKKGYIRLGKSTGENPEDLVVDKNNPPSDWEDRSDHETKSDPRFELALNGEQLDGVFDYVEGNRTTVTKGNVEEYVDGFYRMSILKGGMDVYDAQKGYDVSWVDLGDGWHKYETQWVHDTSVTWGSDFDFFGGANMDVGLGLDTDVFFGGRLNVEVAPIPTVNARLGSVRMEVGYGWDYDYVEGEKYSDAKSEDIKARQQIKLRVNDEGTSSTNWGYGLAAGAGVVVGGLSALIAWAAAGKGEAGEKHAEHAGVHGAAAASYVGLAAAALWHRKNTTDGSDANDAEVVIEKDSIETICRGEDAKNKSTGSRIKSTPKTIELCAEESITLKVGGNEIIIQNDSISILAKNASSGISLWSEKDQVLLSGQLGVQAKGGASGAYHELA